MNFDTLFLLLGGHALCDFALQSDVMAKGKNRHISPSVPPGQKPMPAWWYWLTAHSLIHGMAVYLITGSLGLGIAETVLHWGIDSAKCDNLTGIHTDQGLHIFCKVCWWCVS